MTRILAILLLSVLGCHPLHSRIAPVAIEIRKPSRWVLENRSYADLGRLSRSGEAKVAPDCSALVLIPVYEDRREAIFPSGHCPHSLTIRYGLVRRVGLGETVEVEVRLEGENAGRHVVEVRPTKMDVELLTPDESVVHPGDPLTIKFTASTPGVGGVTVRVLECSSSD